MTTKYAGLRKSLVTLDAKFWVEQLTQFGFKSSDGYLDRDFIIKTRSSYWGPAFRGAGKTRIEASVYKGRELLERIGIQNSDWAGAYIELLANNNISFGSSPSSLSVEEVTKLAPDKCPCCGGNITVEFGSPTRQPGFYCNDAATCGWDDYLPGSKIKLCSMESVIPKPLLDMLKTAPENETFRTRVHAVLKRPLPDNAVTIEAIREWVERNIDPVALKIPVQQTAPANQPGLTDMVSFDYEVNETENFDEIYHCTQARTGAGTFRMSRQRILEIVRDNLADGEVMEGDVIDNISEIVRENAVCNTSPSGSVERGDADIRNEEITDSETLITTPIMNLVCRVVRESGDAELIEAIEGINPGDINETEDDPDNE